MNSKCKHLRIRSRKYNYYGYCIKYKKEVPIFCKECNNIEYKQYNAMKSRTYKQTKREKERFSIIYRDLNKCCECGLKSGDYDERIGTYTTIEKNEVYSGAYRGLSIELGMIAPLCIYCHKQFHKDRIMNLKYKAKFQKEYIKTHTLDNFISTFKKDYIYELKKISNGTLTD